MSGRVRNWTNQASVAIGWAAVLVAPLVAHISIVAGRVSPAAAAILAVQALAVAAIAWRQTRPWRRGLGLVAALGLLVLLGLRAAGSQAAGRAGLIASSGLSHAVIYSSLLLLFGHSLRPGRVPLVTRLAHRIRGPLTPAIAAYTRTVTKAWCGFCLAQLAASVVLFSLAPARVWSLFVNVLDAPLLAAMFLIEFAVRRWRFRHEPHSSPWAIARSFARERSGG